MKQNHIVIIGNGISGITCARYIRKNSENTITVISAETDHFFSRPALMYIYMGHMKYEHTKPYEDWFWHKNRINLIKNYVKRILTSEKIVVLQDGREIQYDSIVVATGSKWNSFGWPGQDLEGVQGLYSYQDLQTMMKATCNIKHAVIVGGGLIGIEMVEMLRSRNIPVTFLVREKSFWNKILPAEESEIINRHILQHHIDLRLESELQEIQGNEKGKVKAVLTKSGEIIPCEFVGLAIGVSPNIKFLEGSDIETDRGILVNDFFETNIPEIYAIGDCAQFRNPFPGQRPIEQVWYTGKEQGKTMAATLSGNKKAYQPGIWFNSAKFLDIEYHTYGEVPASQNEGWDSLYYENSKRNKFLRIVFDVNSLEVKGFNALGIRLKHPVCELWILEKQKLGQVISNLKEALFDPEFSKNIEPEIQLKYRKSFDQDERIKETPAIVN